MNESGVITTLSVNNVANKNVRVEIANKVGATISNVDVKNPSTIAVVQDDVIGKDQSLYGSITNIHISATKDVTVDVAKDVAKVGNVDGNASALTLKQDGKDAANATDVLDKVPENSDPAGIVSAVASKLNSSVVITSGTAVMSDIGNVKDTFDKNGSKVSEEYEVVIKVDGVPSLVNVLDATNRNKFVEGSTEITDAGEGKTITVYVVKKNITTADTIKDNDNAWKVKSFKVEKKK